MTTLTMRLQRNHFTYTGPDIEPLKFTSRREAKDWCAAHRPGSSIKRERGRHCAASDQGIGSPEVEMVVRVVMFSAIFLAATSVVAAAETRDDGGRLGIGQGANSCWAWTRSHRAKAATQDLYTQWVAGFVSGLNWNTDDPDILTEMDFDGLMAWVDNYCKANPLAKVTTGAAMLVQELRERAQRK